MADDKLFTPEFVFDICVGLCVHDYLCKELVLHAIGKHYSILLTKSYRDVVEEEMSFPAEEIVRFISEQKNLKFEAHEIANFFIYNRLKFDGIKGSRKLSGIFSNAFSGDKTKKYSSEKTVKSFKAFIFALKNGTVEKAPAGWTIKVEDKEELKQLGEIVHKDIKLDEVF